MAVPKRKTSPMKRGFRRSADALAAPTYVEDKDSGELRRPHHVDLKTGMYRGRQVFTQKDKEVLGILYDWPGSRQSSLVGPQFGLELDRCRRSAALVACRLSEMFVDRRRRPRQFLTVRADPPRRCFT